jgi:Cu2+-exporting ATPase
VLDALGVARRSERFLRQNVGPAFACNFLSVPLAMAGHGTRLAALRMSASLILVLGNAMRLGRGEADA